MTGENISGNFNLKDIPIFPAPKPATQIIPSASATPLETTDLPPLPGFPICVRDAAGTPVDRYLTDPAVVDLDGDGLKEILVGGNVPEGDHYVAKLFCYNSDGTFRWEAALLATDPSFTLDYSLTNISAPSVGDINRDGQKEIVITASDGVSQTKVFAFNIEGGVVSGIWPVTVEYSSHLNLGANYPILSDINCDGKDKICVRSGSTLYVLTETGDNLAGWPHTFPGYGDDNLITNMAIANVQGDLNKELIVTFFRDPNPSYYFSLKILDSTGNVLEEENIPVSRPSSLFYAPLVTADADFDGLSEIFVEGGLEHNSDKTQLFSFSGEGSLRPGFPTWCERPTASLSAGRFGPDNQIKIFAPSDDEILIINASDGNKTAIITENHGYYGGRFTNVFPIDLDGDNFQEIVFNDYGGGGEIWAHKFDNTHYFNTSVYSDEYPTTTSDYSWLSFISDVNNDGQTDYIGIKNNLYSLYGYIYGYTLTGTSSTNICDWPCSGGSNKRENNFSATVPGTNPAEILPATTWHRTFMGGQKPIVTSILANGQKQIFLGPNDPYHYGSSYYSNPFCILESDGSMLGGLRVWGRYFLFSTLANLTPSSQLEIVVANSNSPAYTLTFYDCYGNELFSPNTTPFPTHSHYQKPVPFDLDDDGLDEIAIAAHQTYTEDSPVDLYFYNGDGSAARDPIRLGDSGTLSAYNTRYNIAYFGADKKIVAAYKYNTDPSWRLKVIDYQSGSVDPAFDHISFPADYIDDPIIQDIDNDGRPEIIMGETNGSKFWIFKDDGSLAANCPPEGLEGNVTKMLIIDLRNEAAKEIYVPASDTTSIINGYASDGSILSGFPVETPDPEAYNFVAAPLIAANLDLSPEREIAVLKSKGKVWALRPDGTWLSTATPVLICPWEGQQVWQARSPEYLTYDDTDMDGYGDLIFSRFSHDFSCTFSYSLPYPFTPEPTPPIKPVLPELTIFAYPIPADRTVKLVFSLPEEIEGELAIYNTLGQKVKTIHSGVFEKENEYTWNATDNSNNIVGSGVYFCRLTTSEYQLKKTIVLVK